MPVEPRMTYGDEPVVEEFALHLSHREENEVFAALTCDVIAAKSETKQQHNKTNAKQSKANAKQRRNNAKQSESKSTPRQRKARPTQCNAKQNQCNANPSKAKPEQHIAT